MSLITDTETVAAAGLSFAFTDRNAALLVAEYSSDLSRIDTLIDWPLMQARQFNNTDSEPDRLERRMAEFLLVHANCDVILV